MAGNKIFLFGLDKAGKTALSRHIKNESPENTKPTLAFNLDKLVIDDIEFQIWDAPGQISLRKVWKNGFQRAKILLFVLDVSIPERFAESKNELENVLNNLETREIPLIFCFNKMDLQEAKDNHTKAREVFKLPLITERNVFHFNTSMKEEEGKNEMRSKLVELISGARW